MAWSGRVLVLLALTFAVVYSEEEARYDGYGLLRVHPETHEDISVLRMLMNDEQLDFWMEPSTPGHPVDILASPDKMPSVRSYLNSTRNELIINDVQSLINDDVQLESLGTDVESFDFNDYHTIDSINEWLIQQAKQYPNIATVITAGKSSEGRELMGLRIAHSANLPIVFIEAGIHAREWISPATALWFIDQVLRNTTGSSAIMKAYEWHIFPSVNPDGYAYTQKNRLWRKTRSMQWNSCYGVDANRNWPFKWQSGTCTCFETYPGRKPASEPETQGLMKYLDAIAKRTRVYISLHSYSQLLMYPWGYTSSLPANSRRFDEIAGKAVAAIRNQFGTSYRYGPIATTIYPAYGNTIDYAYSINITYPFVFELRDTGRYGFLLPPDQIVPTAKETLKGVQVILEEAKK